MPRVHTALADASWSFGSEEKGVGVAAMRDVTARTIPWIPPTDRTGRGRPVDGIMPAGGLTETTRQTTSAEDPSSDAISFCLPIKWRLPVGTRYGYPKPTHQSGASGGCSCDSRPAEGWTAEAAIAFGEFVQPCATTLSFDQMPGATHAPGRGVVRSEWAGPVLWRPMRRPTSPRLRNGRFGRICPICHLALLH